MLNSVKTNVCIFSRWRKENNEFELLLPACLLIEHQQLMPSFLKRYTRKMAAILFSKCLSAQHDSRQLSLIVITFKYFRADAGELKTALAPYRFFGDFTDT